MKKIIAAVMAAMLLATVMTGAVSAHYFDRLEERKAAAHAVAETARAYGYTEDSAVIQAASADWWAAQNQIEEELDLLTRVVYREAGASNLSDRHQQLVAAVVINRCMDPRFPSTIHDVVYAVNPVQYSCYKELYTISRDQIPQRCYENARKAAYGEVDCPSCVVWQAGFFQGRGLYCRIGNTFFCY